MRSARTRRRSRRRAWPRPRRSTESMVDLVKIRKKKAKSKEDERSAGVPPAEHAASSPPVPVEPRAPQPPPAGETPARSAGETPALQPSKLDHFKAEAGKR